MLHQLLKSATFAAAAIGASAIVEAQPAADRQLTVRFLAERLPDGIEEVVIATGDTQVASFELPRNNLSERIRPGVRAFYIRANQPQDVKLARVTLPLEGNEFVVILVPSAKGGYRALPVAINNTFRAGDVYFYNHTSKTLLGYIGSARFTLNPSKGGIIRPAGAREGNFYDVGFGIRDEEGDRALSLTRWPVTATARGYVFFFEHPENGRIDYRAVDEFVPPSKPPARL
jgi:hypothetical protein